MPTITTEKPDDLSYWDDQCAKAAEKYKDHLYAEKLFESLSKDMLAALKMKERREHPDASETELETRARASEEWKTFRKEQFQVLRDASRAEITYDNARRRWETARSKLSIKKKEIDRGLP